MKPKVSIICLAYNHEKFIERAIKGFLMQKTSFVFEVIIHDDASTDKTVEIIKKYQNKYPEIIKPIFQQENQYSKKRGLVTQIAFKAVKGEYVAFCEGDDYWIDPYKLQKQVDFLECNESFSLCFHDAIVLWEDKKFRPEYFCKKNQMNVTNVLNVIENCYIPTASMVFRKKYVDNLPKWFSEIYNGDWGLQMILGHHGKIMYFNDVMSVYRKNKGSLSGSIGKDLVFINKKKGYLLNEFNEYSKFAYNELIIKKNNQLEQDIKFFRLNKRFKLCFKIINVVKKIKVLLCN